MCSESGVHRGSLKLSANKQNQNQNHMSPTAGKHGKENLSTSFETPMTIFKRWTLSSTSRRDLAKQFRILMHISIKLSTRRRRSVTVSKSQTFFFKHLYLNAIPADLRRLVAPAIQPHFTVYDCHYICATTAFHAAAVPSPQEPRWTWILSDLGLNCHCVPSTGSISDIIYTFLHYL